MNKKAFTMFETLIVMAIIAIMVILSLKIFQNADEKALGDMYAKAYKTLNTATYNILQDVKEYNDEKNLEYQEKGISGAPTSELKRFPDIPFNDLPTPANLCSALVGAEDGKGYLNAPIKGCTISGSNIFMSQGAQKADPSFVTSDGFMYYITDMDDGKNGFYLVWVDINGGRRPNTSFYKKKKKPDIVPFVISKENGVVVPQGIPVYEIAYMKARVLYADPDLDKDYSIPMTFAEARRRAYGSSYWKLDPMSKDYDSLFSSMYTDDVKKPTLKSDSKCSSGGYSTTRDFPPCMVEVSTFSKNAH